MASPQKWRVHTQATGRSGESWPCPGDPLSSTPGPACSLDAPCFPSSSLTPPGLSFLGLLREGPQWGASPLPLVTQSLYFQPCFLLGVFSSMFSFEKLRSSPLLPTSTGLCGKPPGGPFHPTAVLATFSICSEETLAHVYGALPDTPGGPRPGSPTSSPAPCLAPAMFSNRYRIRLAWVLQRSGSKSHPSQPLVYSVRLVQK